jgi:tagaturonate reductase
VKKLSYHTLKELNYRGYLLEDAPERVLQFGEGNFLRAFVDYFIDVMNEKAGFDAKAVLVQPISGGDKIREFINEQEGLYTLFLRGSENGRKVSEKRVISSVSRCLNPYCDYDAYMECARNPQLRFIACNTTEAGIQYDESCRFADRPASSYPGKLTQFLYARYEAFGKERGRGFVILSCELIDHNGKELEKMRAEVCPAMGTGRRFYCLGETGKYFLFHAGRSYRNRVSPERGGCNLRGTGI